VGRVLSKLLGADVGSLGRVSADDGSPGGEAWPQAARLAGRTCFFEVALPDGFDKLLFALLHLADQRLIAGFFVLGGPENHFGEDGSEIEAFGGQDVDQLSAVGGIFLGGNDAMGDEPLEAIGEDVGGDAFVGGEEFFEGAETAQHHVAENQEGPAVAEHFDGGVEGASGAAVGNMVFGRHKV